MAVLDRMRSSAERGLLGVFTVVWYPLLEAIVDKKPSSVVDRPQTYLAGLLCLSGIGVLELLGTE